MFFDASRAFMMPGGVCTAAVCAFARFLSAYPCFMFLCEAPTCCFPGAGLCFVSIFLAFEALFDLVLGVEALSGMESSIYSYPFYDGVVRFLRAPCEDDDRLRWCVRVSRFFC